MFKTHDIKTFEDARNKITEYLCVGGFFNPEMMEHDKVRDLLMEIRDLIDKTKIDRALQ